MYRRRSQSSRSGASPRSTIGEFRSALLPVLLVASIWCFIFWTSLWFSLYDSLSDDVDDNRLFNRRGKGVLAKKLEQFLAGSPSPETVDVRRWEESTIEDSVLRRMVDPDSSSKLQQFLKQSSGGYPNLIIEAFLETALETDGTERLASRASNNPQDLVRTAYPYNRESASSNFDMQGACSRVGAQWTLPTSHPPALDKIFDRNVLRKENMYDHRHALAGISIEKNNFGFCPVDADPFLPWLHDVFPSGDGSFIELVISNKRRCNTDPNKFVSDLINLEPQIALMQPVPVKRGGSGRYVLATSIDDADKDGRQTRFICRFHSSILEGTTLRNIELGETLSTYSYNPEHANYLKRGSKPILTSLEQGHDEQIWNAVWNARCPVPQFVEGDGLTLQAFIASGKTVLHGVPSVYLDLVPVRTPARRTKEGFGIPGVKSTFDPDLVWGDDHYLPPVQASGRLVNIPVCLPPTVERPVIDVGDFELTRPSERKDKTHFLVGCVWAAHSFSTRGQTTISDQSTSSRLLEFLTYHTSIAGFDHVYVYDNSLSNRTLQHVTDLFPRDVVTRIPWPHRVCNNNRPMHSNPGERSSQYAAESSCRARYGPNTLWMASLDVDEYLIPTGNWTSIREWLEHVTRREKKTKILSFFQTRALPDVDTMLIDGIANHVSLDAKIRGGDLVKDPNKTFLETYNCEPTVHPKPQEWAWRAKKQIYNPSYVLNHFVHYSVVSKQVLDNPMESSPRFVERKPFERRVDELNEGFMLHTKTTAPDKTRNWSEKCTRRGGGSQSKSCNVGIPSKQILGKVGPAVSDTNSGNVVSLFESNCYRHQSVINLIPHLEMAMKSVTGQSW